MWARAWTIARLIYLYLQYLVVGRDEEGFQILKGGYLIDPGAYAAAA